MKYFITGGSGFIGSVVVRQLIRAGHDVVCLVRSGSRTERIDELPFERWLGDVLDRESLRSGMARCDATIHLAAPGGWSADDAKTVDRVIVGGAQNILEAASGIPGHRVVVVSSTAAVNASDVPQLFDERAEFTVRDPVLVYAHAKHRAEILARDAYTRGVPVVVVNPAEVYGPDDRDLVTAGNLIDFATSVPVLVCRGGTSVVHVEDVAAGIIAAMEQGRAGERYILGGDNLTIEQLAALVVELRGRRVPIVRIPNGLVRGVTRLALRWHLPVPYNPHVIPYATRYWFVDNTKARRELGVRFRGARETIGATLGWLEDAGHLKLRHARRRD